MRTETAREKYLNTVFGATDPALAPIRDAMTDDGLAAMAVGPHEARLLQFVIRAFEIRTIVEIGTLAGYSALAMAAVLPADGRVFTIEHDEARHARARANFATSPHAARIEARHGAALDVLASLNETYDMVFIDANKREYPRYLDWAERHVRRGGLIVGDNTFLWGAVYGESERASTGGTQVAAMREFNLRLSDSARYNSTLIPTREGMTIAEKLF